MISTALRTHRGWVLKVIDEENASTVWDAPFDTDQNALDEVMVVIEREGTRTFPESALAAIR